MKHKYNVEDVLKYGELRFYIVDVIEDYEGTSYYMCCEATQDAKLDFNFIAAFEIKYDESDNELIRMISQESDLFRELLTLEAHKASMELIPEYKDKFEEALKNTEEE